MSTIRPTTYFNPETVQRKPKALPPTPDVVVTPPPETHGDEVLPGPGPDDESKQRRNETWKRWGARVAKENAVSLFHFSNASARDMLSKQLCATAILVILGATLLIVLSHSVPGRTVVGPDGALRAIDYSDMTYPRMIFEFLREPEVNEPGWLLSWAGSMIVLILFVIAFMYCLRGQIDLWFGMLFNCTAAIGAVFIFFLVYKIYAVNVDQS